MTSDRLSGRVDWPGTNHLIRGTDPHSKRDDSSVLTPVAGRISDGQARQIFDSLAPTDRSVLDVLAEVRMASGRQLNRLLWPMTASGARRARRQLARLVELRVITRLHRQVGGIKGGSQGYTYALDVVGQRIAQTEHTCICSIDKDLDQIPGWHYNFVKQIKYKITPEEGLKHFYTQLLTGDRIDNIMGVPGVGPKTAEKILKQCVTEEELFNAVKQTYQKAFPNSWDSKMLINGQLLKIRTKEGEKWHLPTEINQAWLSFRSRASSWRFTRAIRYYSEARSRNIEVYPAEPIEKVSGRLYINILPRDSSRSKGTFYSVGQKENEVGSGATSRQDGCHAIWESFQQVKQEVPDNIW